MHIEDSRSRKGRSSGSETNEHEPTEGRWRPFASRAVVGIFGFFLGMSAGVLWTRSPATYLGGLEARVTELAEQVAKLQGDLEASKTTAGRASKLAADRRLELETQLRSLEATLITVCKAAKTQQLPECWRRGASPHPRN